MTRFSPDYKKVQNNKIIAGKKETVLIFNQYA